MNLFKSKLSKEEVEITKGIYGKKAVLKTFWSKNIAKYLKKENILELEIIPPVSWKNKSLSFLVEFPNLLGFKILDLAIHSVEPIHSLHNLKFLSIGTYCKTELKFSEFPHLGECQLYWRPKADSLFECKTLKKLWIYTYKSKAVTPFTRLENLQSLAIVNSSVQEIRDIGKLKQLKSLELSLLRKLNSLSGIEDLSDLEELEVHTCRAFKSIDPIKNLKRLKKLWLINDGDIQSLKPVEGLSNLESVLFYESTNIVDGDFSPLTKLKKLKKVSFADRKHYSHTAAEINGLICK